MSKVWSTASFLKSSSTTPNALILLNTRLPHDALFRQLWAAADVRYCADGGANRLYDQYMKIGGQKAVDDFLPDMIKGDLDSLRADVKDYYASKGVPIHYDPDEYSTDLGKCVEELVGYENRESKPEHQLVIVGGLSGRLDQTIHTVHALTLLRGERKMTWAVGRESVACVLDKGKHELHISLDQFGKTCGILPIGELAKVTSKGLRWDVGPDAYMYPTSLATAVSTSNHLVNERIEIETDVPIVWTVEVRDAVHD